MAMAIEGGILEETKAGAPCQWLPSALHISQAATAFSSPGRGAAGTAGPGQPRIPEGLVVRGGNIHRHAGIDDCN